MTIRTGTIKFPVVTATNGAELRRYFGSSATVYFVPVTVPQNSNQEYFWTEEWQAGERSADEEIKSGEVTRLQTEEELDAYIESLTEDAAS